VTSLQFHLNVPHRNAFLIAPLNNLTKIPLFCLHAVYNICTYRPHTGSYVCAMGTWCVRLLFELTKTMLVVGVRCVLLLQHSLFDPYKTQYYNAHRLYACMYCILGIVHKHGPQDQRSEITQHRSQNTTDYIIIFQGKKSEVCSSPGWAGVSWWVGGTGTGVARDSAVTRTWAAPPCLEELSITQLLSEATSSFVLLLFFPHPHTRVFLFPPHPPWVSHSARAAGHYLFHWSFLLLSSSLSFTLSLSLSRLRPLPSCLPAHTLLKHTHTHLEPAPHRPCDGGSPALFRLPTNAINDSSW